MSLRRYAIFYAPIEHLNGKYEKADYRCSNQIAGDSNGHAFYYGYRRQGSSRSLVAYRDKCRDLSRSPYSASETAHMTEFAQAVQVVRQHWSNLPADSSAWRSFMRQRKYRSFWGYCLAATLSNNGVWPFNDSPQ